MAFAVALYRSRAEFDAAQPSQVIEGVLSQHKALRTAVYALAGLLPFHGDRFAVARAESADRTWVEVIGRV